MKRTNKNLLVASAIIMISPLLALADSEIVETSNSSSVSVEQNEYSKYYSIFKLEFYNDLEKGIFTNIDNKIKGYKADRDYLKSNPDSPYYNNYAIYELKAKVLEDLKNNFSNFKENLPVVKEDIQKVKENFSNTLDTAKNQYDEAIEMAKKAKELTPELKEKFKTDFSNLKGGVKEQIEKVKTDREDVRKKIGEIIKTLEEDLKTLRESITPENLDEVKAKAEALKKSYLEKVSSLGEEAKKILENRFEIFFKNQFTTREDIHKVKENFSNTLDTAKIQYDEVIEMPKKAKELNPELKQKFKTDFTNIKAGIKDQIQTVKTERKDFVNNKRNETKNLTQDLKMKYKNEFISKLKDKLDMIPQEKLSLVLENITKKREQIVYNTKLTQTNKDRLLAQLDALTEIINEKLGVNNEENINIEELLK